MRKNSDVWAAVASLVACLFALTPLDGSARLLHRRAVSTHPLLVGYFPQWGLYYDEPYSVKQLVDNGSAGLLDQINYAQGFVSAGRCSVADPRADLETTYTAQNSVSGMPDDMASQFRGYFHQLKELKRRYPHLKILISLEGDPAGFAEDARPENRKAFVASCIDIFIRGHFGPGMHEAGIFDGFDIDWEYPNAEDAANFQALLEEFRRQMHAVRSGLRLSIAVGHSPRMLAGMDFAAIARLVNQVGIMNYDYTGPWNSTTGFLAPLFSNPVDPRHSNSIEANIGDYVAAGVPREKLLMGMPFYGYCWTGVNSTNNGLFQSGKGVRGDRPYRYIRKLITEFSAYRDEHSQAPWLFDGTTFWTYEDPVSVRFKASYAAQQKLGGVMIWELSDDTPDAELLTTAHRALRHPLDSEPCAARSAAQKGLSSVRN
ncbi:MAG: chitinase [Silvibacterium sp.]|nr:chitinase [Silvibacterium sp.]